MPNGPILECHLNTGHVNTILFSYILVQYLNGRSSTYHIADKPTILNPNFKKLGIQMFPVFKWSVFRSPQYLETLLYSNFLFRPKWYATGRHLVNSLDKGVICPTPTCPGVFRMTPRSKVSIPTLCTPSSSPTWRCTTTTSTTSWRMMPGTSSRERPSKLTSPFCSLFGGRSLMTSR